MTDGSQSKSTDGSTSGWRQRSVDVEGSLEAKLPTTWTDGKAQPGRSRARKKAQPGRSRARKKLGGGESQKGEDQRWRGSEERRCRCAKR